MPLFDNHLGKIDRPGNTIIDLKHRDNGMEWTALATLFVIHDRVVHVFVLIIDSTT